MFVFHMIEGYMNTNEGVTILILMDQFGLYSDHLDYIFDWIVILTRSSLDKETFIKHKNYKIIL